MPHGDIYNILFQFIYLFFGMGKLLVNAIREKECEVMVTAERYGKEEMLCWLTGRTNQRHNITPRLGEHVEN